MNSTGNRRLDAVIAKALNADWGGADTTLARESSSWRVEILGHYSPTSQLGGRVFSIDGIAPSIMAGTHGYGFGCILTYEEDTIEHH